MKKIKGIFLSHSSHIIIFAKCALAFNLIAIYDATTISPFLQLQFLNENYK